MIAVNSYESGFRLFLLNLAIGLGTFIQVLDTSIANVAIPYIAGNLGASPDQGTWVITSFSASNAVVLPLTGWLSSYFGSVRLFVWSVLLFALISFLCGISTTLSMLVFFRILQGAVAGSLIPLSQSLLMAYNPPEKQGVALGFWAMIVVVAPILGPIVGGYLTQEYSWPWIFHINVPIGIFSAFFTWYLLRGKESKVVRYPIDWIGLTLLIVGVASLQILLDKGRNLDWFESNAIWALAIISAVSLSYFAIWTYFQEHPIVDFSFFKDRNFTLGTVCLTLGYFFFFGSTVTIPLWLQTQQHYTSFWAGVAVAPIGIAPILFATSVGKYMRAFDLRRIASLSFALFSAGYFYQSSFTTQASLGTIMFARFLQGFGLAFFFLPLLQISLSNVPKEQYPAATGLNNFIRILVGSGFGTSIVIYLWIRQEIFHHSQLAEKVTLHNPVVRQFYENLKHPSITPEMIHPVLDKQIEQQAFMLSTNDLSSAIAWGFLLLIPLIYMAKNRKNGI